MPKITFMGAGSTVFAKNVLGDSMMTPALAESTIALYDIDAQRLQDSRMMLENINRNNGNKARVEAYLGVENRKDALRGANYVVNAIQVGLYDPCTIIDFEVPKKYGLRQTIADTLGIGGIFRALRTIPVMFDFARDMEEVCPDALFLNYTNPMAMLTGAMLRVHRRQDRRPVPQRAGLRVKGLLEELGHAPMTSRCSGRSPASTIRPGCWRSAATARISIPKSRRAPPPAPKSTTTWCAMKS